MSAYTTRGYGPMGHNSKACYCNTHTVRDSGVAVGFCPYCIPASTVWRRAGLCHIDKFRVTIIYHLVINWAVVSIQFIPSPSCRWHQYWVQLADNMFFIPYHCDATPKDISRKKCGWTFLYSKRWGLYYKCLESFSFIILIVKLKW
jgi:hypothetical protein